MNFPMASDHPFQLLFETLGRSSPFHAESVNQAAFASMVETLSVPLEKTGRCVLLRAPRAGHGKTHLLSRTQQFLGATHEFIPLQPAFGNKVNSVSVTNDVLRRMVRPLPASGGLCMLDLATRRLFASALQPLVGSGEVPCQDREGALSALRMRPIETFDFHHANAVTAHWARENFEVLGQRLSLELAERCNLPVREIAFWVDALFRFAATPVENPGRIKILMDHAQPGNADEGAAMERLEALLGLLSQLNRVVLVADDLEGFSADETAALKFAAFVAALRQSVERLDVVLSLNVDVWESAFLPRLSGGLADRLSEVVIDLMPLTEREMAALLESRVPGLGSRVLEHVNRAEAGTHARGLIRAAGLAWMRASAQNSAVVPPPPAEIPAALHVEVSPPPAPPIIISPPEAPQEIVENAPPLIPDEPSIFAEVETSIFAAEISNPLTQEAPPIWPSPEFIQPPEVTAGYEPSQDLSIDSPFEFAVKEQVIEECQEPISAPPPQFESPFQIAEPAGPIDLPTPARSENYSPEIAPSFSDGTPAPPEPAPSESDSDRVDELLRQFRDRYGRGSL